MTKMLLKGKRKREIYTTGHGSQRTMATGKGHNYPVRHISHWHHVKKTIQKTFRNWAYQNTNVQKAVLLKTCSIVRKFLNL